MVEALIKANANLDILDISGCTALQLALENENVECIQILLNEKGNWVKRDGSFMSTLNTKCVLTN